MECLEIVSDIKLEPEVYHLATDVHTQFQDVIEHMVDMLGAEEEEAQEPSISIITDDEEVGGGDAIEVVAEMEKFCERIQDIEYGSPEMSAAPPARNDDDNMDTAGCTEAPDSEAMIKEQKSPPENAPIKTEPGESLQEGSGLEDNTGESDLSIQDSGGVLKDHNYSLFKDVNPINQLLMMYYMHKEAKDAPRISETNLTVCKMLELLATIVSTSSADLIGGAIEMIEGYTHLMRRNFCEKERQREKVLREAGWLKELRDLGQFMVEESNKEAEKIAAEEARRREGKGARGGEGNGEECSARGENTDSTGLKQTILDRLNVFRLAELAHEATAVQTDEAERVTKAEISCQTDPPPPPSPVKPLAVKYFSSSDIDSDSSGASASRRKRKRRRKKELLESFFGPAETGGDGAKEAKAKRAERRVPTGSDEEIDRLINLDNLDRVYQEPEERVPGENSALPENGSRKSAAAKKGATTEDILAGLDILNESSDEGQRSEQDDREEETFLKQLNLEHKNLLLNSSSEGEESLPDFDRLFAASPKDNGPDSDVQSVDEEAVEAFLSDFKGPPEKEKPKPKIAGGGGDDEEGIATDATTVSAVTQRRDSVDEEVARLLRLSDDDDDSTDGEAAAAADGRGRKKNKSEKSPKREQKGISPDLFNDEATSAPLDLSDTVGKRSRTESTEEADKNLGELMMNKRKAILNSQTAESLDAIVMKVHQMHKNPLLAPAAVSIPSPRDPDCISLSSSSSLEDVTELAAAAVAGTSGYGGGGGRGGGGEAALDPWRRKPRKMISEDKLDINTKKAQRDELDRLKRLEKKNELLKKHLADKAAEKRGAVVLDVHPKTGQVVQVHHEIVKHLKEHQVAGIKFMYDCSYGSIADMDKHAGSGCILAHCMGLGKTLQQIALMHTVVQYAELKTSRIMVLCPKSTVMNWVDEVDRWAGHVPGVKLKVFFMPDSSDLDLKLNILQQWYNCGRPGYPAAGLMLLGHEAFRILVLKKLEDTAKKEKIKEVLLDPGPDLVICDEGHVIKNPKSAISKAVGRIKTAKRIILTGTPIQNNLKEYFCMVSFIKPMFLGTLKEFCNLYVNPIKSGQHKDSTRKEIKVMQQRSYVLHKKLEKFVQRREAATLKQFLPEKYEYVVFVPLTPVQERLYKFFLNSNTEGTWNGRNLIADYTFLRKIWTHPKVLETAYMNAIAEQNKNRLKEREKRRRDREMVESDEDVPDDVLDKRSDDLSVTHDWWRPHLTTDDLESLFPSHKLRIMFEILRRCEENNEKCLIFSAFVAVLNVVEYFMNKIHSGSSVPVEYGIDKFSGPWVPGKDYYRLDGKTSKASRHAMIKRFNDPLNTRVKAFLISAKAGGMGINLTGANRVIILDTSWNPSNDQQNIFRIFRLGQKRNCYVYRLLAMGTMEEKVYSRAVTKQALSSRVVDEQQIDRHYSMAELAELYVLSMPDFNTRPVPIRPADLLLANLVHTFPNIIFKYHIHDSLLENKPEEDLSEEEKREAWLEYDKQMHQETGLDSNPLMANPFDAVEAIRSLGQMGPSFGGFGGPLNPASIYSLLNQYPSLATDPYMQRVFTAATGLQPPPPPAPNPYMSYLTGGNNFFSSGTLFPDTLAAGAPAATSSSNGAQRSVAAAAAVGPSGATTAAAGSSGLNGKGKGGASGGDSARTRMVPSPASSVFRTPPPMDNFPASLSLPGFDSTAFWGGMNAGRSAAGASATMTSGVMGRAGRKGAAGKGSAAAFKTTTVNDPITPYLPPNVMGTAGLLPLARPPFLTPLSPSAGGRNLTNSPNSNRITQNPIKPNLVNRINPNLGNPAAVIAFPGAPPAPSEPPKKVNRPRTAAPQPNGPGLIQIPNPTPVGRANPEAMVILPSSSAATIEKLPLTTPAPVPSTSKAPILPAVPQSITVEKISASVGGGPGLAGKKSQSPLTLARRNKTVAGLGSGGQPLAKEKSQSLKPTEVIDLIDDVLDANPGLSVKSVMRPPERAAANQLDRDPVIKNVNVGIKYPNRVQPATPQKTVVVGPGLGGQKTVIKATERNSLPGMGVVRPKFVVSQPNSNNNNGERRNSSIGQVSTTAAAASNITTTAGQSIPPLRPSMVKTTTAAGAAQLTPVTTSAASNPKVPTTIMLKQIPTGLTVNTSPARAKNVRLESRPSAGPITAPPPPTVIRTNAQSQPGAAATPTRTTTSLTAIRNGGVSTAKQVIRPVVPSAQPTYSTAAPITSRVGVAQPKSYARVVGQGAQMKVAVLPTGSQVRIVKPQSGAALQLKRSLAATGSAAQATTTRPVTTLSQTTTTTSLSSSSSSSPSKTHFIVKPNASPLNVMPRILASAGVRQVGTTTIAAAGNSSKSPTVVAKPPAVNKVAVAQSLKSPHIIPKPATTTTIVPTKNLKRPATAVNSGPPPAKKPAEAGQSPAAATAAAAKAAAMTVIQMNLQKRQQATLK